MTTLSLTFADTSRFVLSQLPRQNCYPVAVEVAERTLEVVLRTPAGCLLQFSAAAI